MPLKSQSNDCLQSLRKVYRRATRSKLESRYLPLMVYSILRGVIHVSVFSAEFAVEHGHRTITAMNGKYDVRRHTQKIKSW